jgi:DNA-binding MarR family transcriptional regulator
MARPEKIGRIDRRAAAAVVPHIIRFFRRLGGLMARRRDPLTPSQKAALFVLEETGASPMGSLGRALGLSAAGASRIVDRLEAMNLARRRPGPNRRTVLVVPTPAGRRSARAMRRLMEGLLGRALGRLPPGTAATVIEFYRALERAAEEVAAAGPRSR